MERNARKTSGLGPPALSLIIGLLLIVIAMIWVVPAYASDGDGSGDPSVAVQEVMADDGDGLAVADSDDASSAVDGTVISDEVSLSQDGVQADPQDGVASVEPAPTGGTTQPIETPAVGTESEGEVQGDVLVGQVSVPSPQGGDLPSEESPTTEDVSDMRDSPSGVEVRIVEFVIENSSGNELDTIKVGTWYNLRMLWDASSLGDSLHDGDQFVVTLPDAMRFPTNHAATHFELYSPDGAVVGNAVVNSGGEAGGGTVTVTFTDYVEGRSNVRGTMYLSCRVIEGKVQVGETNYFEITVGATTATLGVIVEGSTPSPINSDEVLTKWASLGNSTDEYVQWEARINASGQTLSNVIITDSLSVVSGNIEELRYLPDAFVLMERKFDSYGSGGQASRTWWSKDGDFGHYLTFSADGRSFTLDLNGLLGGDVGNRSFSLIYRSTNAPGVVLKNHMSLTSEEGSWQKEATYTEPSSGGTGSGDMGGRIQIVKVDATDGDARLAGAEFTITSADGSVSLTVVTDENGEALTRRLVPGEYTIVEISAPAGYKLDPQARTVNVTADGLAQIEVANEPEPEPEPDPEPEPEPEPPTPPSPPSEKPTPGTSPTPKPEKPSPNPAPKPKPQQAQHAAQVLPKTGDTMPYESFLAIAALLGCIFVAAGMAIRRQ